MRWQPFEEIEGCGLLELDPKFDDRGYFMEMFNKRSFAQDGIPLPWGFAQENLSWSNAGVLRGFHIQRNRPQGKLITCLSGRIMDVCLDLRPTSPTYLKMTRVILDHQKPQSFWCPPGTAHAFLSFQESCVHYLCSTVYDAESDSGVNASSPEVQFVWPPGEYIQSDKDKSLPMLMDFIAGAPRLG
jgi:dTDP-4-dehydrorhamnose 3,5-epimerase